MDRGRDVIYSRAFRDFTRDKLSGCSLAAAVLGGSALGAGASIWGANKAAGAQTDAAAAAIANQNKMYDSNKGILSPFINAGAGGIDQLKDWLSTSGGAGGSNALSSLLKLVMPGSDQSATLQQTPGYQFAQGQGTRGALNALAARGLGGSPGAIAKGVSTFNSGLASQTWDSVVKNLLNTFQTGGNALQGLVNTGVTAGGALAGVGTNTANSITGSITGAGNAQAAGANATGAAIGGIGNATTTAALLQQLGLGEGGGGGIYGAAVPGTVGPTSYGGPQGPAPLFGA